MIEAMNTLPAPFDQLPIQATSPLQLEKHETLFRQGESVSGLYYIESGEVTFTRFGRAGEEIIIHLTQPQETFAEASLFSEVYHCNAIATQGTQLWKINKTAVLNYSQENPSFVIELAARFAGQIQKLRSQRELLAIRSANERVYTAISQGLLCSSIKTFSNTIGLSHEATYRALAALVKEQKIIKTGRGSYSLPQ